MNSFMNCFTYNSPVGKMCIQDDGTAVTAVFLSDIECSAEPSPLAEKACAQLDEYFRGERKRFTIPVKPAELLFSKMYGEKFKELVTARPFPTKTLLSLWASPVPAGL